MIPRTYPSTFALNGQQQMVVYFLTDVTNLQRWVDYIPVKLTQGGVENSYDNNGFIDVAVLPSLSASTQAWKEYIPVYQDDNATDGWQVNSVGYIPYNYAQFGDASLMLDFTNGGALDPRITFSRASNATVTGADGTLQYAPHNLLTYSEQFDASAWGKTNATVTANAIVAPDGTTTADLLLDNSTNGAHQLSISASYEVKSYTASVYMKQQSASFYGYVRFGAGAIWSENDGIIVDLSDGSVVADYGLESYAIENVGNGWFRISITDTPNNAGTGTPVQMGVTTGTGVSVVGYTGDGTSGIYIWGAQLNVGSLQDYHPTTVKNLLGYTQEFDNAAWTKSNSFVQTNLLLLSENLYGSGTGTGTWNYAAGTVASNIQTAPDGSTTADRLTTTGGAQSIYQSATVSASTTYTFSVYVQLGTMLASDYKIAVYDNSGLGFIAIDVVPSQTPTTSGWTRITYTFTTPVGCTSVRVYPFRNGTGLSSCTVFLWGAQLVQGETAGNYTRTDSTVKAIGYTAPDGSVTADKLVENTATVSHYIGQGGLGTVVGQTYTLSYYAKAGEYDFVQLSGASSQFGSNQWANFDLVNGVVGNKGSTQINEDIVAVGNGWYRCSITITALYSSTTTTAYAIICQDDSASRFASYTGDGTSGIYIWGAQLSDSASVDPYVYNPGAAPSASAYYGARFDYDPVTLAPKGLLIEEQRTNLLIYSEQFDNAAWSKSNSFVQTNLLAYSEQFDNAVWIPWDSNTTVTANATIAPDGTLTADKLDDNNIASPSLIFQTLTSSSEITAYTASVYLKAGTSTECTFNVYTETEAVSNIYVNLTTGAVTGGGTNFVSSQSQDVGNGWFRVTLTYNSLSAGENINFRVWATNRASTTPQGYIYVWGAQLVKGESAGEYTRTESTAKAIGYTSPDGTTTADKLIEDTSTNNHLVGGSVSASASTIYTLSVYVKAGERTKGRLRFGTNIGFVAAAVFDLTAGTVSGAGSDIQSVGNEWYRLSITGTTPASTTSAQLQVYLRDATDTETYTGDGTSGLYIWGAQLEAGAFPTSYIPTTSAQVTRSADVAVMTGDNFSNWYNQNEGTFFIKAAPQTENSGMLIYANNSAQVFGPRFQFNTVSYDDFYQLNVVDDALNVSAVIASTDVSSQAAAFSYKADDYAVSQGGGSVSTDTSSSVPSVIDRVFFGSRTSTTTAIINGHISRIAYYPRRLSNAELQGITS